MRSLSRSAARSSRRLLVLAAVAAVCTLGLIQPAAFAAGTPPPQPFGLNAQANASNSITLTWSPTPTATSYRLYRGTSSGGEGATPIATTTSLTYYSTTTGTGGTQTLSVSGTGRYLRMYGTVRGTGYGYSLWEFQVFGT
jgi:hypothetical protein